MFQESFYMFKALKKIMWTCGFLYQKSFSLIKCSPNHFKKKFEFQYTPQKAMCSKHSKNKNTYAYLDFNTQISFYTYTFEFVIMVRSKVIDLTIM
jgi:hypothetical protein